MTGIQRAVTLWTSAVDDLCQKAPPHRCFDAAFSRTVRDLGFTADDLDELRNAFADQGGHP